MGLAKTFVTVGNWIEKHFPEKLTAAEVNARYSELDLKVGNIAAYVGDTNRVVQTLNEYIQGLQTRVAELEKKAEVVNSDLNKTKIMLLTQRQTAGR